MSGRPPTMVVSPHAGLKNVMKPYTKIVLLAVLVLSVTGPAIHTSVQVSHPDTVMLPG